MSLQENKNKGGKILRKDRVKKLQNVFFVHTWDTCIQRVCSLALSCSPSSLLTDSYIYNTFCQSHFFFLLLTLHLNERGDYPNVFAQGASVAHAHPPTCVKRDSSVYFIAMVTDGQRSTAG